MTLTKLSGLIAQSAIALTFFSGIASATTYSAVNDFSLAGNPNGVWSYLSGGNLTQTAVVGSGTLAGLSYWYNGQAEPNSTIIGKNTTAQSLSFESITLPTNYLLMDPEGVAAIGVEFTAPAAGTYTISGNFLGIDSVENSHPVDIQDNGTTVYSAVMAGYGDTDAFNLTETLNAGDTINFQVRTGGTFTYLSTGLLANITVGTPGTSPSAAPEPASIALIGLGLAAFGVYKRRSRVG